MRIRSRRRKSTFQIQREREQRRQLLKELRRRDVLNRVKYNALGTIRYINKNSQIKIKTKIAANSLVDFCFDNNLDQIDFNHMIPQVYGMPVLCFCLFNNINKKFYIQPLLIANSADKDKNKNVKLDQVDLLDAYVIQQFEDRNIEIEVLNQIWLCDILDKIFQKSNIFNFKFKVKIKLNSFSVAIFLSCYGCGFVFKFNHRDAWMSSLQTDLENIFLKFVEWARILSNISEKEVWSNFEADTFFPCSNITVWKKIVNHCALSNKFHLLDKDCDEEKNLNKLFKLIKHAPNKDGMFHFRNSIKIGYRNIGFLGVTFNKSGGSILFLSILKSFNLFKEFEEDVAFILLTFL